MATRSMAATATVLIIAVTLLLSGCSKDSGQKTPPPAPAAQKQAAPAPVVKAPQPHAADRFIKAHPELAKAVAAVQKEQTQMARQGSGLFSLRPDGADAADEGQLYLHPQGHFALIYPAGWLMIQETAGMTLGIPLPGSSQMDTIAVLYNIFPAQSGLTTAQAAKDMLLQIQGQVLANMKMEDYSDAASIDGKPAAGMLLSYDAPDPTAVKKDKDSKADEKAPAMLPRKRLWIVSGTAKALVAFGIDATVADMPARKAAFEQFAKSIRWLQ